jgi:hypothetical protein
LWTSKCCPSSSGTTAPGAVTQELERGDSGLRSFVSVQSALLMYPIQAFGSEARKAERTEDEQPLDGARETARMAREILGRMESSTTTA